jgi:hypothetical protein
LLSIPDGAQPLANDAGVAMKDGSQLGIDSATGSDATLTTPPVRLPARRSTPAPGSHDEAASRLADYMAYLIRLDDGGPRNAWDSEVYNRDNDAGYMGFSLGLAGALWGKESHIDALKRLLEWYGQTIDADGCWHWGYARQQLNMYTPFVGAEYTSCIDAAQSFPMADLAIYAALRPSDTALVSRLLPIYTRGIEALVTRNYEPQTKFFYSSSQYTSGAWKLFNIQYSAGQADVNLGLRSAFALTQDPRYQKFSDELERNVDARFWAPALGLYSVGGGGAMLQLETTTRYPFAQGWLAWVMPKERLPQRSAALATYAAFASTSGNVSLPGGVEETNFISWLAMGLKATGDNETLRQKLLEELIRRQLKTVGGPQVGDGSMPFSATANSAYGSVSAWAFIALAELESATNLWR